MASTRGVIPAALFSTLLAAVMVLFAVPVNAQNKSVFTGYKGITIGMPTTEVREKLGKAATQTDAEDYWEFSESETARVIYDNKKVRTISINYMSGSSAPTPKAILGQDLEPKADGSMFKIVQYPKDGYWISYVKTGGDDAMVIVTVQKMQNS